MPLSLAAYTPLIDYDSELGTGVLGQWDDQSGNGHHATQATPSKRPVLVSGSGLFFNYPSFTIPAFRFVGASSTNSTRWVIPDAAMVGLTGAVGVEAFLIFKRDNDPITSFTTDGGIWNLGNGSANWLPFSNGFTYENFFSNSRKDAFYSGTNRGNFLSRPHLYNVWSMTSDWGVVIDNGFRATPYSTVTNTFQVPPAGNACLGTGGTVGDGGVGFYGLTGHMWRFVLFARKLSAGDRLGVTTGLKNYYSVAVNLDYFGRVHDSIQPVGVPLGPNSPPNFTVTDRQKIIGSRNVTGVTDARADRIRVVHENRSSFGGGSSPSPPPTTNVVQYFKMRARDPDCGSLTYRTWIVTGAPDYLAAQYAGAKCGANPLVDIVVDSQWDVAT